MAQLLSNLPVGAKVKFGKYSVNGETAQDIAWLIVAKNHTSTPAYPTNSVTLLAEKIVDLRCFDAAEPSSTNSGTKEYGLARYDVSNIRQWLNSSATGDSWYTTKHPYDQSPSSTYVSYSTPYASRPGFLNAFNDNERNAILTTTIRYYDYSTGYKDLSDKVFLPSYCEISGTSSEPLDLEGAQFSYFANGGSTLSGITSQAYNHSPSTKKPTSINAKCAWWTRSSTDATDYNRVYLLEASNSLGWIRTYPKDGSQGVRPALNLSSTISVSDTTDSDGSYTVILNVAPPQPSIIHTPTTIYGGKSNAISWSSATDPDGDTVTYTLECSLNGGEYSQIYSGASTVYAHLVPFGTTSVAYRVKATDPSGESSAYTTSNTITVINNNAPVIDGSDANLGVLDKEIKNDNDNAIKYKVTDANSDTVTVTESIDGVQIRSLRATLGVEITCEIKDNTWLTLANGSHTLTIRATDGIDSTVRTYTFTKLVETLVIQNSTPWVSTTMPSRIMLVITRNIPSESTFEVAVCNNGYDTTPIWEDCTDAVKSGLVHVFANKVKTAGTWGVLVRVTVNRNGATGACYISAIGGNFE